MFQLILIVGIEYYFIDKIKNKTTQIVAEVLTLGITLLLIICVGKVCDEQSLSVYCDWYPKLRGMFGYFAMGSFVMRHLDLSKLMDGRIHSVCLLLFCVTIALHKSFGVMSVSLQCVAAIYCCIYIFKECFTEGRVVDYFKRIGKRTLQIYILHFFFGMKFAQIGNYLTTLVQGDGSQYLTAFVLQLIISFALSIVIIELSLLAANVIKTSKLFSFLLLGEK